MTHPSNDSITIHIRFSDGCTTEQEDPAAQAIWHRLFGRLAQRMPFRCRAHREPGVHCHAKPRHESRIPIRLPFVPGGVPEGSVIREPDSRNRIGPNRCLPGAIRRFRRQHGCNDIFSIHFFFFFSRFVLISPRARQLWFLSGPLNFRLFVKLNWRVKSAKNN